MNISFESTRLLPVALLFLLTSCTGTGTRTLTIPHTGLVLKAPTTWHYVPAGLSVGYDDVLGFLSTTSFRPPCGFFTVHGQDEGTCFRPVKLMPPPGVLVEIEVAAGPLPWYQARRGKTLRMSGHPARIMEESIPGGRLPWYCPLNTQRVTTAVLCLAAVRCGGPPAIGNYGVISACLHGPDLPALAGQVHTMLTSARWTFG